MRKKIVPSSNGQKMALVYCRVSTKGQEDGYSLQTQANECVKFAASLGYSVGRITKEVYSGAELWDRPLLAQDREDIKAGKFQAIVCYAIDRLSRDIAHLAILAEEFERIGCELIFVTEDLDNSPQGKLLRSVQSYVAEVEREKIKERTIRGKRQRLLAGKIHNVGPNLYGYRRNKELGRRIIYEPEAQIVRRIFQWVTVDGCGLLTVAKRLTAENIPSPYAAKGFMSNSWNATAVRNIITNSAYKGETVQWVRRTKWRKGKANVMELRPKSEHIALPDGTTPPIVTPELWAQAQERLATNNGEAKRNQDRPYLLRGHIICSFCGMRMYPMPKQLKSGKKIHYYRCSSAIRVQLDKCPYKVVRADLCENYVWQEVLNFLQKPDVIAAEIERIESKQADSQLVLDKQIAEGALKRTIQGQQRLVKRLREADDGLAEIIERELLQIEKERQILLTTIAELEGRILEQDKTILNLRTLYDYCQDVAQNLTGFDFNKKRLALEALGVQVLASGKDWKVNAKLPLNRVVQMKTVSSSCLKRT